MKLAIILFSVLTSLSLSFVVQRTPPVICRGKALPIKLLPGPKMTGPSLPLRFGGAREFPRPPVNIFPSDKALRLVIKSRDEFSNFWKQLTARVPPGNGVPPPPEIDFSKEMVVVAAMGERPTSGYWTIIDGACEVDGQVEVFVSNVEDVSCAGQFQSVTHPADAVRLPQTDLPVVFRESQIPCIHWAKQLRLNWTHAPTTISLIVSNTEVEVTPYPLLLEQLFNLAQPFLHPAHRTEEAPQPTGTLKKIHTRLNASAFAKHVSRPKYFALYSH
jgi:hypothetical protein